MVYNAPQVKFDEEEAFCYQHNRFEIYANQWGV